MKAWDLAASLAIALSVAASSAPVSAAVHEPAAPTRVQSFAQFPYRVRLGSHEFAGFSEIRMDRTKYEEITLERGVTNDSNFANWAAGARAGVAPESGTVSVVNASDVSSPAFSGTGCTVVRYTGTALGAKGGNDVALEELVLSCQSVTIPRR